MRSRRRRRPKEKKIEVKGIIKEWAIKEYFLRMLGGDVDDLVSKNDVMVSAWNEALVEAWKSSNNINSEEYI